MTVKETRFKRGDRVELPKRLGGGLGAVVIAWHQPIDLARKLRGADADTEVCIVARVVGDRVRHTVIADDELYRVTT